MSKKIEKEVNDLNEEDILEVEDTKEVVNNEIEEETFEEKEITVMDMLNRIVVCLIIIAIILAINTVVLICKDNSKSKNNASSTTTNNTSGTEIEGYDVSMMNEVSVDDVLGMFKNKGTYVLYIGRSSCSACVSYLPSLQKAQSELGYTTQYLDISKVDSTASTYESLLSKLSLKYTMTISGEERTETFGTWFGYTPMTIIIKDGKMVDGEIGAIGYDALTSMLKENGIK